MAAKTIQSRLNNVPGTIYLNKNRYWWKVQLPGEDKPIARPLKPVGAKFATTDLAAAIECAKTLLQNYLFQKEIPVQGEIRTIADLARAYSAKAAALSPTASAAMAGFPTADNLFNRPTARPAR